MTAGPSVPSGFSGRCRVFARPGLRNPGGSVKDRTGLGIAFAALNRGYRVIFAVPARFFREKQTLMRSPGAETVNTPGEDGMPGAEKRPANRARPFPARSLRSGFTAWPARRRMMRQPDGRSGREICMLCGRRALRRHAASGRKSPAFRACRRILPAPPWAAVSAEIATPGHRQRFHRGQGGYASRGPGDQDDRQGGF